jgi:hypothetical protein
MKIFVVCFLEGVKIGKKRSNESRKITIKKPKTGT